MTAIAVAASVAAGGLVASFDRLGAQPQRFGASWDVVVGQYSQPGPLGVRGGQLHANPAVVAAAGYYEQTDAARVDGQAAVSCAPRLHQPRRSRLGEWPRARDDSEVALGRTAREIHKGIGDEVRVTWETGKGTKTLRARVVGIVVVNDPISSQAGAGSGILVTTTCVRRDQRGQQRGAVSGNQARSAP